MWGIRIINRVCPRPGNVRGKINDDLRRLCDANISSGHDGKPSELYQEEVYALRSVRVEARPHYCDQALDHQKPGCYQFDMGIDPTRW